MKKRFFISRFFFFFAFVGIFSGCTDNVDESSMFISNDETITEYLESNAEYSDFVSLIKRVQLSEKKNASTLDAVLSARGNYLCFVPTNEALQAYVDDFYAEDGYAIEAISDSLAGAITKSCIINYDDENAETTVEFPTKGAFRYSNLNDRILTCLLDSVSGKYIINTTSKIMKADIELSNGYIQEVDAVVAPSSNTIPTLLSNTPNMQIFSHLLKITNLADSISNYRDEDYEKVEREEKGSGLSKNQPGLIPQHRYFGYTVFVEPDEVFKSWGIPEIEYSDPETKRNVSNWDAIEAAVLKKCEETYTNGSDDYTNKENALHQFVGYHLIKGSYAFNKLVRHYNEYQYQYGDRRNPQTKKLGIEISAFFETFAKERRMLKVLQVSDESNGNPMYINRKSIYDKDPLGKYDVLGVEVEGIQIHEENEGYDNNALNGFVYPLTAPLLYTSQVVNRVFSDRLRMDVCTILPEFASNNCRGTAYWFFPNDFFEKMVNVTPESELFYICYDAATNSGWHPYEGDSFHVLGVFDFTIKLPAPPKDGTYEVRMGANYNARRGMAQIYFGKNPNALAAVGLPIDMRQAPSSNPNIPWQKDVEDQEVNRENDKDLRNQGVMKGPNSYGYCDGTGNSQVRNDGSMRIIIARQPMKKGETYYLRYKSCLEQTDAQFYFDYVELVPKEIYANENDPEDVW